MYKILLDKEQVGTAEVKEEGLYYLFVCICNIKQKGIHRICVEDGINKVDLGICVPYGNEFILQTRIPKKRFLRNTFSFSLISKQKNKMEVPVQSGMTFEKLEKLNTARLETTNGQQKLVIDESQDQ